MKSLNNFLNEHLVTESFDKTLTFLETIKVNFSKTARPADTKAERVDLAKEQEQYLVSALQNALPETFTAQTIEEWCDANGKSYSPKFDLDNGDIVLSDGTNEYFIDLKVSNTDDVIGTPCALSLVHFANKDNHYYFLSNISGSNTRLIYARDLYDYMVSGDPKAKFICSKNRTKSSSEVSALYNKVSLVAPKGTNYDTSKLYDEDFVATSTIRYVN